MHEDKLFPERSAPSGADMYKGVRAAMFAQRTFIAINTSLKGKLKIPPSTIPAKARLTFGVEQIENG